MDGATGKKTSPRHPVAEELRGGNGENLPASQLEELSYQLANLPPHRRSPRHIQCPLLQECPVSQSTPPRLAPAPREPGLRSSRAGQLKVMWEPRLSPGSGKTKPNQENPKQQRLRTFGESCIWTGSKTMLQD